MIYKYQWKPGATFKVDPQTAGERLNALAEENDGNLTTELIVDDARIADSPFHGDFEWDNEVAAEKWRNETARQMIKLIAIVQVEDEAEQPKEPVRAFVNVRRESGERAYVPVAYAVGNEDLYAQVLDEILRSIQDFRRKLAVFKQFSKEVDTAFRELEGVLSKSVAQD